MGGGDDDDDVDYNLDYNYVMATTAEGDGDVISAVGIKDCDALECQIYATRLNGC